LSFSKGIDEYLDRPTEHDEPSCALKHALDAEAAAISRAVRLKSAGQVRCYA